MSSKIRLWHVEDTQGWTKKVFDNIDYERCDRVEDADYILVPNTFTTNYHDQNLEWLKGIYKQSVSNKPYIAFLHDDPTGLMIQDGIDYTQNGILFRTSFYKSQSSQTEYALPSFDKNADESFLPLAQDNVYIGFCGALTHSIRGECLDALTDNPLITTKFRIRNRFHLHFTKEEQNIHERQFTEVLRECPYQLCSRGAGNFSHRFYETLMHGRIPVLVDTDIPLPNDIQIDYDKFIVIAKTAKELPEKLIDWHNKHDIIQSQTHCRKLWEEHLSPSGFAKSVHEICKAHLVNGFNPMPAKI